MLKTWIHRIRRGKEDRLRDWLAELSSREAEVRESLLAADVNAEQAFVLPSAAGSLLVYVSEAPDQRRSADAFAASTLPIDIEHRRVMEECIEDTLTEPPAYDILR